MYLSYLHAKYQVDSITLTLVTSFPKVIKKCKFEESFFEVGERLESSIRGSKTKVSASKTLKSNKIGAAAHFQHPRPGGVGAAGVTPLAPIIYIYFC